MSFIFNTERFREEFYIICNVQGGWRKKQKTCICHA